MIKRIPIAILSLGGAILLVSTLHFFTPVDNLILHQIYQRVYYIPIIVAAFRYGWRGGLGAAALAGLSYLPHILMHWQHLYFEYALNQYAEIALFFAIGSVTGWLGDQKQREHERAERINKELQSAYADLRETVGQLLQAERLSSLAEIASSVVHEVRNPLAAIKGAVEILEDEIPEESPRREFARIAKIETERIDKLVGEFVRLAKAPKLSKRYADINEVVNTVTAVLGHQAEAKDVEVNKQLDYSLPPANMDVEQIEQVLLNLGLNALDAVRCGGSVVFRTLQDEVSVIVEVEDTGPGISMGDSGQIFDPFFTTKEKGSGLGLSIARKIVTEHGGDLTAANTGNGAQFRMILQKSHEGQQT